MNNSDWLDEYPPELRMRVFLDDLFAGENRDDRIAALSVELGYTRPSIVASWIAGKTKVPLKALRPIASFTGRDVCQLIGPYLAQEMKGEDGDRLYQASKSWVSRYEWSLIAVARDIYLGDDDEDDVASPE